MLTVRDVMTRSVISVHPWTPLKEVAQLLVDHCISGAPVVDDHGAVIGVVSEADFLVKEQGAEAVHHRRLARILGESKESTAKLAKIGAFMAREAMTAPATTIASSRRISDAASLMGTRSIDRLPVVDDGRLVGIVTRGDLLRAFVRPDSELARTIRREVLLRTLWLDPDLFSVIVEDGMALVSGGVERRSTAEMVERAVRMVPGIMDVHADVTWKTDDSRLEPASSDPVFPFGMH